MKKRYYVSAGAPKHKSRILRTLARELRCEDGFAETVWSNPTFDCAFNEDDPRLIALRNRMTQQGIKWSERYEFVYICRELRAAALLEFSLRMRELDIEHPYPEQFDLSSGCRRCGTGARQVKSGSFRPPTRALDLPDDT